MDTTRMIDEVLSFRRSIDPQLRAFASLTASVGDALVFSDFELRPMATLNRLVPSFEFKASTPTHRPMRMAGVALHVEVTLAGEALSEGRLEVTRTVAALRDGDDRLVLDSSDDGDRSPGPHGGHVHRVLSRMCALRSADTDLARSTQQTVFLMTLIQTMELLRAVDWRPSGPVLDDLSRLDHLRLTLAPWHAHAIRYGRIDGTLRDVADWFDVERHEISVQPSAGDLTGEGFGPHHRIQPVLLGTDGGYVMTCDGDRLESRMLPTGPRSDPEKVFRASEGRIEIDGVDMQARWVVRLSSGAVEAVEIRKPDGQWSSPRAHGTRGRPGSIDHERVVDALAGAALTSSFTTRRLPIWAQALVARWGRAA